MSSSPSPSLETVVESDTEDFETEHDSSFTQEFIKNEITALREEISRQLLLHKEEIIKLLKEENTTLKDEILSLKKELSEKDKLIYEVEKDVVDLQQYIRRNNVEICGIPNNVETHELEDKVVEIAKIIDVKIEKRDIEACHRLKVRNDGTGPKRTIVRFTNRKNCDLLHKNKKKLKDSEEKLKGIGIHGKIFINNNLCPYNKMLWGKCKRLFDAELISRFWVFNGSLYYALSEQDSGTKVDHLRKLQLQFPEFDFHARSST